MRPVFFLLLILGLAVAIITPSTLIEARRNNKKATARVENSLNSSENVETIDIQQVAERDGRAIQVNVVQRVDDPNGITINVVAENRSGEDWLLTPQNFMLQDREHIYTYPAQAASGANALQPGVLHPGESRSGALQFQAPLENGLDLAFGLLSDSSATYVQIVP